MTSALTLTLTNVLRNNLPFQKKAMCSEVTVLTTSDKKRPADVKQTRHGAKKTTKIRQLLIFEKKTLTCS